MKVLLLNPPVANAFYPPLALPSLAAYIRERSPHECFIADLSIEGLQHLLSPLSLEKVRQELDERYRVLASCPSLTPDKQLEFQHVSHALLMAPHVIQGVRHALRTFRDATRLRENGARASAIKYFGAAMELITAAHLPFEVESGGMKCGDAPFGLEAVRECVERRRSPFADFLEQRVDELVDVQRPQVVGVSINYYGQLLAGLEVVRHVKRSYPELVTVVGGGLMPELGLLLADNQPFRGLIDYVICYEGESALVALLDMLEVGGDHRANQTVVELPALAGKAAVGGADSEVAVPNLVVRRNGRSYVPRRHREQVDQLPIPDFSDFMLGAYLSPKPILPLLTSRGCYYADCAFCTHFHTYGVDYRVSEPRRIVEAIAELARRHDTSFFYFVDESLAPSKARAISCELLAKNLEITWGTEIRFEKALTDDIIATMADSGCRVLSFGLESGVQRVLDLMDKGIDVGEVHRILNTVARNRLFIHVMCIIGFPGETSEEFRQTLSILDQYRDHLAMVGFSPFTLNVNSIVYLNPQKFGVTIRDDADPFRPDRNFDVTTGMSQEEAYRLFEEIEESELLTEIHQRHTVATREHFLLLDAPSHASTSRHNNGSEIESVRWANVDLRGQRVVKTRFDRITLQEYPFDLAAVQHGAQLIRDRKRARLLGATTPPEPEPLWRRRSICVFLHEQDRTLQISESLVELMEFCRVPRREVELLQWLVPENETRDLEAQRTTAEALITSLVDLTLLDDLSQSVLS